MHCIKKIMTSSKFFSFRFFTYRAEKAHFYMIDFCYLVNLSVILQTLFCGCEGEFCGSWFQTNYILTQGPIATAIILWANSLVFHSIDKVNIKKVISTEWLYNQKMDILLLFYFPLRWLVLRYTSYLPCYIISWGGKLV